MPHPLWPHLALGLTADLRVGPGVHCGIEDLTGAAAFLHGPEGLFPSVVPTWTPGELHDDQGHNDAEEPVRRA